MVKILKHQLSYIIACKLVSALKEVAFSRLLGFSPQVSSYLIGTALPTLTYGGFYEAIPFFTSSSIQKRNKPLHPHQIYLDTDIIDAARTISILCMLFSIISFAIGIINVISFATAVASSISFIFTTIIALNFSVLAHHGDYTNQPKSTLLATAVSIFGILIAHLTGNIVYLPLVTTFGWMLISIQILKRNSCNNLLIYKSIFNTTSLALSSIANLITSSAKSFKNIATRYGPMALVFSFNSINSSSDLFIINYYDAQLASVYNYSVKYQLLVYSIIYSLFMPRILVMTAKQSSVNALFNKILSLWPIYLLVSAAIILFASSCQYIIPLFFSSKASIYDKAQLEILLNVFPYFAYLIFLLALRDIANAILHFVDIPRFTVIVLTLVALSVNIAVGYTTFPALGIFALVLGSFLGISSYIIMAIRYLQQCA